MGENKLGLEHLEKGAGAEQIEHGDHALKTVADDQIQLTQEDVSGPSHVRMVVLMRRTTRSEERRTDVSWLCSAGCTSCRSSTSRSCVHVLLPDKAVTDIQLGYGNVFGLSVDTGLVGNQYSLVSTMNAIAQLAWQPFSSYLIVRIPARNLMTFMVFAWGTAQACMAASTNFHALIATRFLLGLFEACCLPVFS